MGRPASRLILATLALLAASGSAWAAGEGLDRTEVRRGFTLVGPKASDAPALRQEGQAHTPSASFALGAALSAWINAAAALDYDLKTPTGDGGDEEAIGQDCYDERTAFTHLEARRGAFGLRPPEVAAAAGAGDPAVASAWTARQAGPPARCR